MIKLYVKELMEKKAYEAKTSELQKMGITFNTARDILNGKVSNIKLSTLNKLCVGLNCTPNELLNYTNTDALEPQHGLLSLIKPPHINMLEMLATLSPQQLDKFYAIMKEEE